MPVVLRGSSADHQPMNSQTIAATAVAPHGGHVHTGQHRWLGFIGHFVEMVVVMLVGMGLLTTILGMPHDSPAEVQALYMAATMTVPMAGWMLFRGHARRATAEMAGAMVVPLAMLAPMLWVGLISGEALLTLQHVLMLPAMLGAMLVRRSEYGL